MRTKKVILFLFIAYFMIGCGQEKENELSFRQFMQSKTENSSPAAAKMVGSLRERSNEEEVTITFPKGRYDFYENSSFVREYYISNHDQVNPKRVVFALENLKNVTIDGQGSEFVFHGRMIPFALSGCENVTLKNFSVDFEVPALRQLEILEVDKESDVLEATICPGENYRIEEGKLVVLGEGYEYRPFVSMAFREDKRLSYRRGDVSFNPESVTEIAPDTFRIEGWNQVNVTSPGERYALRTYYRPTPGIFINESKNSVLENVTVHYAEGMGLLAQMSENITLEGFNVCLKGEEDPRYFTTQADATHFSACKGTIISKNGLYEGMADDAINVHGTYLKVFERPADNILHARYMHPQAWGFKWGEPGDSVQFVESEKMELVGNHVNTIKEIRALDRPTYFGAKEFEIVFNDSLPKEISGEGAYGIENLTWTPEVLFSGNTIRNNRARGTLFSTPKKVICENNLFDHTHGTAILLCGDCNGWYETGSCREVIIRNNKFVNALSANYQFTNAVISIYPEIPNLEEQEKFFHSGIVIENNTFEMFDRPLLYAKSTDGLQFRNNTITYNNAFDPFHWNEHIFFFEKVDNVLIEGNEFEEGLSREDDVRVELSEDGAVKLED
ncbi:hypothetical protein BY457_10241 [Marinilabilia salmonicolor]|jgi:hypothetical protein|uniref:right-handed parallel beta-helix repeat-containing protein n=1 Tax=Marinilabilia salmonicolor TaxID=989 RepID=UPI000D04F26C|nr:right-handed parallel beta-helix repeat-containing protein [Marinilabilia salmonicolor]PRZ01640.1 hypothetical protein BY457_10241 [Marinilabilia salmonicolor]